MRLVMGLGAGMAGICVLIVLIVVGTVATVLAGGHAASSPAAESTPAVGHAVATAAARGGDLPADTALGNRIIELARAWLGVPYLFGGCSPSGVDCSCLIQKVYAAAGIHLPRVAVDQFNATVAVADPKRGDLVFFANTYEPGISHVGIYIGDGLQINAPTTGQVVSVAPVFTGYWGNHYAGARRVRL